MTTISPAQAWARLRDGNARFVDGRVLHPSQGAERRTELSAAQHPFAVVLGCSDSRVAAEIVFDQGLGDLFVVRTAGHVLDTTVIGSIEYGVEVVGASLVVVLGHDSCGAVAAAVDTLRTGRRPSGFVGAVVDRVIPSIVGVTGALFAPRDAGAAGPRAAEGADAAAPALDDETLGREHLRHTVETLQAYSVTLATAVREGRCGIVGAQYTLVDGRVHPTDPIGTIGA